MKQCFHYQTLIKQGHLQQILEHAEKLHTVMQIEDILQKPEFLLKPMLCCRHLTQYRNMYRNWGLHINQHQVKKGRFAITSIIYFLFQAMNFLFFGEH